MVAASLNRLAFSAIGAIMMASPAQAQVKPTIVPAPVTSALPAVSDVTQRAAINPIMAK